jgi:site-specific recombinase XerD
VVEPVKVTPDELMPDDGIISLSNRAYESSPRPVPGKTGKQEKGEIRTSADTGKKQVPKVNRSGSVEFTIRENEGLLVIKFPGRYEPAWIDELKTYGRARFDEKRCEWLLPWSKITCDSLADYFGVNGIAVDIKKQVVNEALKLERKATGDDIRAKELGKAALDGIGMLEMYLDENRYSVRTRETYISALEFFFRYFSPADPREITEDEISRFIYDYIIRLGYSASYQNQMVSAIKTYYIISGKGKVNPDFLERPRRRRALPKVFSKEEVSRILNSARNQKHKLLLWLIYSCGLRRNEVTNIKLTDLDRDRGIIFIREGKGRVDRIVPVSAKVWEKVDDYLVSYSPKEYIFEGQTGGRYSSESVYRVFKSTLLRAGINKEVGVHSLRHSYATHLHENGLDIRYIQELLGHKSTRTTEIYTHVSRRNLIAVRSPIDDLDVK